MTKIMITGATGLLGRELVNTLSEHHDIIATGFSRAKPPIASLDLQDQQAVANFIETHQPNVIIHAAAERKPDVCETNHEATLNLNVAASQHLAECCLQHNIRFIFISTDYVFDGDHAPYQENATPRPLNFYGQSKHQAEKAVLSVSEQHTIIRVPVLYGEVQTLAESAITVIAEQVIASSETEHDHWAIRYPTHVQDIALTISDLIALASSQCHGIFHVSDTTKLTKFNIAEIIKTQFSLDDKTLTPLSAPSETASRPFNCALKDTRLHALGIHHTRDFTAAISKAIAPHIRVC
ncbi:dTDP-4-dehydrorhamnose reductase family protein [Thalassotalea hakodatensis]|uniref:dTDP-4-dehydrorhamnose reductase family protein n=1 Tax=Thalassotalea hakodatensis TaxID=3030492 RepID=UPI0025725EA6|nr:SDR family oxidoreductase [Thalassotalea hakodatensis]